MTEALLPTLLLVEDDPAEARLIMRAIEKVAIPARIVHVKHGDDAVAYLAGEAPFDDRNTHPLPWLVVMDLKLPRRSGLEVLKWIRAQESDARKLPVVMLTASHHPFDVEQAYEAGVNSYLVKPETMDELLSMMSTFKSYWFSYNQRPQIGAPPPLQTGAAADPK